MSEYSFKEDIPLRPLISFIAPFHRYELIYEKFKWYLENIFPEIPLKIMDGLFSDPAHLLEESPTSQLLIPSKTTTNHPPTEGIIRHNWIHKHQYRLPAVAVILIPREHAAGDPTRWAEVMSHINAIKIAAKQRSVRIAIIIIDEQEEKVDPPGNSMLRKHTIPDERISMLARQANIDKKSVVVVAHDTILHHCSATHKDIQNRMNDCTGTLATEEPTNDDVDNKHHSAAVLHGIGTLLHAQAIEYYNADAQRRLDKYLQGNVPSVNANLRAAFKIAALAEQRGDWSAAAKLYREAYTYVPQSMSSYVAAMGSNSVMLQRFLELRAVAEVVNFRMISLFFLALQQPDNALLQLSNHLKLFRKVPSTIMACVVDTATLEAMKGSKMASSLILQCNHEGWLSRQLHAAADAMSRVADPSHMYLSAAKASASRRRLAARVSSMLHHEHNGGDVNGESDTRTVYVDCLQPGRYIGQYNAVTDNDILSYFMMHEIETARHSQMTMQLLQSAQRCLESKVPHSLPSSPSSSSSDSKHNTTLGDKKARTMCHINALLGEELLSQDQIQRAQQCLAKAAQSYRKDGWNIPLRNAIMLLRECAARQQNRHHHIVLSLEAASCASLQHSHDERPDEQSKALAEFAINEMKELYGENNDVSVSLCTVKGGECKNKSDEAAAAAEEEEEEAFINHVIDGGWQTILMLRSGFLSVSSTNATTSATNTSCAIEYIVALRHTIASAQLPFNKLVVVFQDDKGYTHQIDAAVYTTTDCGHRLDPGVWHLFKATPLLQSSGMLHVLCIHVYLCSSLVIKYTMDQSQDTTRSEDDDHQNKAQHGHVALPLDESLSLLIKKRPSIVHWGKTSVIVPPRHQPPCCAVAVPRRIFFGEKIPIRIDIESIHTSLVECMIDVAIVPATKQDSTKKKKLLEECNILIPDIKAASKHSMVFHAHIDAALLSMHSAGSYIVNACMQYKAIQPHNDNSNAVYESGAINASIHGGALIQVEIPFEVDASIITSPQVRYMLPKHGDDLGTGRNLTAKTDSSLKSAYVGISAPAIDSRSAMTSRVPSQVLVPNASLAMALHVILTRIADVSLEIQSIDWKNTEIVSWNTNCTQNKEDASSCYHDSIDIDDRNARPSTLSYKVLFDMPTNGIAQLSNGSAVALGSVSISWMRYVDASTVIHGHVDDVRLPRIVQVAPVVAAAVQCPPRASVMGQSVEIQVELNRFRGIQSKADIQYDDTTNGDADSKSLRVTIDDSNVFLIAGPRSINVSEDDGRVITFMVVPYHCGFLKLPDVRVIDEESGSVLELTKECFIFVDSPCPGSPQQVPQRDGQHTNP